MLGRVLGKDGIFWDYGVQFLDIRQFFEAHYAKDVSAEFKKILEAYCQGVNDFAKARKQEVLAPRAFPCTPQDILTSYTLILSLMGGLGLTLKAIKDNRIEEMLAPNERGSNAIAVAPSHTEDGKTWLCVNSHQPLEGNFSWYEAHLTSEEGLNVLGGLFPGCVTVMAGVNENLGWAHTTNYSQWGDVYLLKVNPKNSKQYLYDGKWQNFAQKKNMASFKDRSFDSSYKAKTSFLRIWTCFKNPGGKLCYSFSCLSKHKSGGTVASNEFSYRFL